MFGFSKKKVSKSNTSDHIKQTKSDGTKSISNSGRLKTVMSAATNMNMQLSRFKKDPRGETLVQTPRRFSAF